MWSMEISTLWSEFLKPTKISTSFCCSSISFWQRRAGLLMTCARFIGELRKIYSLHESSRRNFYLKSFHALQIFVSVPGVFPLELLVATSLTSFAIPFRDCVLGCSLM